MFSVGDWRSGLLLSALICSLAPALAQSSPAPITWDWYRAAEIYMKDGHDRRLALHYFRLAASRGNAAAAYKLGEMYENGWGAPRDYDRAREWYEAGAGAQNRHAEFKLGWLHHKGLGVPRDTEQARLWYEKSGRQGNEWAFHMLAFMYADGDGVTQDLSKARALFERSLPATDDPWAKWKLATLILDTQPARAKRLLRESSAAGNTSAQQELDRLGW